MVLLKEDVSDIQIKSWSCIDLSISTWWIMERLCTIELITFWWQQLNFFIFTFTLFEDALNIIIAKKNLAQTKQAAEKNPCQVNMLPIRGQPDSANINHYILLLVPSGMLVTSFGSQSPPKIKVQCLNPLYHSLQIVE